MMVFLRTLPNTLWWITALPGGGGVLHSDWHRRGLGAAPFRSGRLLTEFIVTVVFLGIPLGIGWYGRQRDSLWYTGGGLFLFVAMARIFFF